ncbi:AT-hook motif nuclear-localized protein 7-like [Pistacia vera]|uniref:AT-hook motif nuclear-localized protein 7-like n=1 Tax=Pistacia vera TaxID=55513 RepID=UPI001262DCE4|nr:AT-hook motif nuclear-localized protein 7-like [Pistacia vera]
MEEKESTISGSTGGNSYTDSPPPVSNNVLLPQPPPPSSQVAVSNVERNIDLSAGAIAVAAAPENNNNNNNNSGGSGDLFGKKKRGRPRKYDSEGNLRLQPSSFPLVSSPPGFTLTPSPDYSSSKRGRGRPPGSGNWQLLASLGELFANTAGGDFTPHVVTVNTGEDVAGKILSFSQKGPRGICILSANGAVSNVTIRQPGSSGGILTYEGRFEILSLSGSFTVSDTGGVRSRTGGLSVSLAGPDGRVIGGGLAGLLLAASPIQIVVGSFMPNGYKVHKRKHHREHVIPSMSPGAPDTVTAARPISQAKPYGETCLTPVTPILGQNHAEVNNTKNNEQLPNVTSSPSPGWNGSETTSNQGPSPDINVSLLSE